ncbi:sigma 54-interacting transcriptional regulator, partial [Proteus mirabilis]|uniref:sigma 54-interacting transcriptional regulator n=1 Tax=Proteus mirabilis TaxID=584 RepID=UPI000F11472E
ALVTAKNQAKRIAAVDSTVLILGESGTGKELFTRSIHAHSKRKNKPFRAINCAAIPEHLLESELFGYTEGAFTGANRKGKMGKFEMANGGTIFLDEIGDMPLHLQVKILRVLEERTVERIGGNEPIPIDVRIIA